MRYLGTCSLVLVTLLFAAGWSFGAEDAAKNFSEAVEGIAEKGAVQDWPGAAVLSEESGGFEAIETAEELVRLARACPAEVGFCGVNFKTGKVLEYGADRPACLASMVKIFVLLEVMRQEDEGQLSLAETVVIKRGDEKETCSMSEAIDKMIGVSDNEATDALARRVGYDNVNALAGKLSIERVSKMAWPEPGVLEGVLDARVFELREVPMDMLLPMHGTAKAVVQYYRLLHERKLISRSVSEKVLAAMVRSPKRFAPGATPKEARSVGKGGSLIWKRPGRAQYNMRGWGLYIFDEERAVAFCLWTEWFPEEMAEKERWEWAMGLSDCIVNLLLEEREE